MGQGAVLIIIMHNRREYLNYIRRLAETEGIKNNVIVKRDKIGMRLIGGDANFVLFRGNMYNAYNMAFMAAVENEEKIKRFLDIIENNGCLEIANLQNKGFICMMPLEYINDLDIKNDT